MKILHYINNLGSGGAEKLLTDILPIMKKQGNVVHLAYSNNRRNVPEFDEIIKKAGIRVVNFNQSFYNPLQVFNLIFLLRKEKYEIVHAHIFPTQYWLSIASLWMPKETRIIKTEHSVFNRRRTLPFFSIIEKLIYGRFHLVIAISPIVRDRLVRWVGNFNNVSVIRNGVNLQEIKSAKTGINSPESSMFSPEKYNILMVGRFSYEKDQNSLIRALLFLPGHYNLFLAGDGPNMVKSRNLIADLGLIERVHFLGVRTDVYILMSQADLNVLSTYHEGLSGVALESMASGRPFIGTDVEGVNDIVPDRTFLFSKANPESLAAKIKEISENSDLQNYLVRKGLEHVMNFDISSMVEKYLQVYRRTTGDFETV